MPFVDKKERRHPMVQKAMESNRKVSPKQYRENMKLYKGLINQLFELQKKEERFNRMNLQLIASLPAKKAIGREDEVRNRMGIYESKIRHFNNLIEENQKKLRAIAPNVCSVYLMYPASKYMTLSEYRHHFTDHSFQDLKTLGKKIAKIINIIGNGEEDSGRRVITDKLMKKIRNVKKIYRRYKHTFNVKEKLYDVLYDIYEIYKKDKKGNITYPCVEKYSLELFLIDLDFNENEINNFKMITTIEWGYIKNMKIIDSIIKEIRSGDGGRDGGKDDGSDDEDYDAEVVDFFDEGFDVITKDLLGDGARRSKNLKVISEKGGIFSENDKRKIAAQRKKLRKEKRQQIVKLIKQVKGNKNKLDNLFDDIVEINEEGYTQLPSEEIVAIEKKLNEIRVRYARKRRNIFKTLFKKIRSVGRRVTRKLGRRRSTGNLGTRRRSTGNSGTRRRSVENLGRRKNSTRNAWATRAAEIVVG